MQNTTTLVTRLGKLRTVLSRNPQHAALLETELHITLIDETLAAHAAALAAGVATELATNDQSDSARLAVTETWNQLQRLVRQATNLLEWHIESNHATLLAEFTSLPTSRAADTRAQHLLNFAAAHPEILTHQDTNLVVTNLQTALTQSNSARAALPAVKVAENTADDVLHAAKKAADIYADCLEDLLQRVLQDDHAALEEYGLIRHPVKVVAENPPVAGGVVV